ncbi:hypothetical protein BB559_003501 [Furculomyces boomerangus]|uniref:Cation efflux protein transmembrane domain-containing protein n=1 Tax=Furculomyces boomerangus TaxID=61424 RepID=A0A2T9Y9F0_9FUNG|nr:hypothetical protein BB559_005302 [Furculomyces boomerangus]PVU93016.1 hypothetical protein BB559_003501 [Furculomyces boomerangus]
MAANLFLSVMKGVAGVKQPTKTAPFGYGKYDAIGTIAVSSILVGAGAGIGVHSLELFVEMIPDTLSISELFSFSAETYSTNFVAGSSSHLHDLNPEALNLVDINTENKHVVNPNAIWFAGASVIINEGLYRITKKVGKRISSDVLIANALHHRGDSWTSMITIVAIGGSHLGLPILDPLGGLVVGLYLAQNGAMMIKDAVFELTDTLKRPDIDQDLEIAAREILESDVGIIRISNIFHRKSGPFNHIQLTLTLPKTMEMSKVQVAENKAKGIVMKKIPNIQSVAVSVRHD